MIKKINGVERELGINDFEIEKLSDKLGVMVFNNYRHQAKKVKDVNGIEHDITVLSVTVTNSLNGRQMIVTVTNVAENVVILEQLAKENDILKPKSIDFLNVVVGHYVNSSANFANLMQTYKAEKISIPGQNIK